MNIRDNIVTYAYLVYDDENTLFLLDNKNNIDNKEYYVSLSMTEKIFNIEITDIYIIIILNKKILIHNRQNYEQISIYNTCANDYGLLLINNHINNFYSVGIKCGDISYINLQDELSTKYLTCHDNAIKCIATDKNNKYLATASICGTLIRVFDVEQMEMIFEFRRGSTMATIYDLSISDDLNWLACCSDHGTLHIFELKKNGSKNQRLKLYDYFSNYKSLSSYMDYLNYGNSIWSREQIPLSSKLYHSCKFDEYAFTNDQQITKTRTILHVVSIEGKYFCVYLDNIITKSEIEYMF